MIFNNFKLPHKLNNSKTLNWIDSDRKEILEGHLKKHPTSIHLQNYIKTPIKYKLNNYGFRTPDDFKNGDEGTVYLGCSHTFGVGHYLENIWSYKLHQKIGEGKFFNLSHGATGLASQYYFLKYFSDKLKIKKVYHFYPIECLYRYGFMNKEGRIEILGKVRKWQFNESKLHLWEDYLIHETYNKFHNSVYKDAIKNVCKEIGCEYIIYEKSGYKPVDPYSDTMTPARDLIHYYVEQQQNLYEIFLKMSGKNNTII